jgi:hypothetical protein
MAQVVETTTQKPPLPGASVQLGPALAVVPPVAEEPEDLRATIREWFQEFGYWYLTSALVHMILFLALGVIFMLIPRPAGPKNDAPSFDAAENVDAATQADLTKKIEVGDADLEPQALTTDLLLAPPPAQTAKYYDDSKQFTEAGGGTQGDAKDNVLGGLNGFNLKDVAGVGGGGGVGRSKGDGTEGGSGGAEKGFGSRGTGSRKAMLGNGGTKASERAVIAALSWLARHQTPKGNWSLQHEAMCKDGVCSGSGSVRADAAATALGLLPFLAAGQTHKSRGPYQTVISKAVGWLVKQQKASGDLSGNADQPMYSHGLATIAMCEVYGMSKDEYVRGAAVKAIRFIEQAQNQSTGGWRYFPGDTGDTSAVGWQVMALKSAQMAHLPVNTMVFENARRFLKSCSKGEHNGLFAYLPFQDPAPPTTAIGLLCMQYLGMGRDDPAMVEGRQYLLANLPSTAADGRNTYYFYYATLVMHNIMGPEWDTWNRNMRGLLIATQDKDGCATGSWDPEKPTVDTWGGHGGRLMTTALSTLTLEVYYRYMPLFGVPSPGEQLTSAKAAEPAVKKEQ